MGQHKINIKNNKNFIIRDNTIYIEELPSNVNIIQNKNSIIKNNRIIISEDVQRKKIDVDWTLRNSEKYRELYEKNFKEINIIQREIKVKEKIRQFIFYSELNKFTPTIRIYAFFSAFSTIRQSYDTDDLSQLELEENALFIKFVELGFNVKVIISLQTDLIIHHGYSIEQYEERCKNLETTIKYFNIKQYKNLQIVIDEYQSRDSMLILDTILIIKSDYTQFDGENFSFTLFESDKTILKNEIIEFDKKFDELLFHNNITRKSMNIKTDYNFIRYNSELKRNKYLEDINKR